MIGKFAAAKTQEIDRMPTMDDLVALVANEITGDRTAKMPPAPLDAARWLIKMFQPAQITERVDKVATRDGTYKWQWPYAERIKHLAKKFMRQTVIFQDYIIAASEDEIYWRGEDMVFFEKIVAEHLRMIEIGVRTYQMEAVKRMKRIVRTMATKTITPPSTAFNDVEYEQCRRG